MGLSWSVISISSELFKSHDGNNWLQRHGINLSRVTETGRNPTPNEVRNILDNLEGYCTIYFNGGDCCALHALVSSADDQTGEKPFYEIDISMYSSDSSQLGADEPHEIYFGKGDLELIILITEKLTKICGSFVLFEGSHAEYEVPILVNPGDDDPQAVINDWLRRYREFNCHN